MSATQHETNLILNSTMIVMSDSLQPPYHLIMESSIVSIVSLTHPIVVENPVVD